MPKKLLLIGVPIIVVLLLGVAGFLFKDKIFGNDESQLAESKSSDRQLVSSNNQHQVGINEALIETIQLENKVLEQEQKELEGKLKTYNEQLENVNRSRSDLEARESELDSKEAELVKANRDLKDRARKLAEREDRVKALEVKLEESRPVPAPQDFSQEDRDLAHKKMARGFASMRPKDVADLLQQMLDSGDEGRADAISLLQKIDIGTRTRILSVIAKTDVGLAAELAQTLMIPTAK